MPDICKTCFRSIEKYVAVDGYQVILIDLDNYSQYVSVDPVAVAKHDKGIISHAHFSDLLRLELLIRYGGIWVDPTVLFTDFIPNDILQSELFVFKGSSFQNIENSSIGSNISNWFIISDKNNPYLIILRNLLYEYWKHHNKLFSYYIFHIYFSAIGFVKKEWWDNIIYYPNVLPHVMFFKFFDKNIQLFNFSYCKKCCFCHKLSYKGETRNGTLRSDLEKGMLDDIIL